MIPKHKNVRLIGKTLKKLNDDIYDRDHGCCIVCGRYVQPGTKFHHVKQAAQKEDLIENGVLLCNEHHFDAHHADVRRIRKLCQEYLAGLYGGNT